MFCPFCKEEIPNGAIKCPRCLSTLPSFEPEAFSRPFLRNRRPIWASVTSMVLGIFALWDMPPPEKISEDEVGVYFIVFVLSIVFASIALSKRHRGRGMAIAGLVLGIIGCLAAVGIWSDVQ